MKFPAGCPRCGQGPVHWVRVEGIPYDFMDCFECDAVWFKLEEFSPIPSSSYMSYVRSFGLDPLVIEELLVDDEHNENC
jgi:hypothetical protein